MYSLKEKENVIRKIRKGLNIDEIVFITGISRSTVLKWKKELELRKYIRKLIYSGNLEEAKKEVEKITGKVNEPIRNSLLIKIAKEEGDRETEKKLLDKRLEIEPNNIKAINSRIRIAREEEDRETEKRLLDRLLELEPNNKKAIKRKKTIKREERNVETRRNSLDEHLRLNPNDMKAMSSRIKIAREERDIETQKRLLDRQLELEPYNKIAIIRKTKYSQKRER